MDMEKNTLQETEVEIVNDDISAEEEAEVAEDATEETEETEEVVSDEGQASITEDGGEDAPKTVPLAALHQEREKLKAIRKEHAEIKKVMEKLFENTGVRDLKELEDRMDNLTLQEYIQNRGMDESTAKAFLMQQKEIAELKKAQGTRNYEGEIQTLRTKPFYADIDQVADDVIEYASRKNITAKEAYNILYAEQRAGQLEKEAEQRALKATQTKQSKKIPALSSTGNAGTTKNTVRLTPTEAWAAELAGMTPAEYAKYRKKE